MTFVSACFAAAVAALAAAVDNPSLEPDLNKKAYFFLTQFKRGLSNCPALRNLSESFSESESFRACQFRVLMHLEYTHRFKEVQRASESFRELQRERER